MKKFTINTFANEQNISTISAVRQVVCFCPLGNDYYTAQITIELQPNELLFDFIDLTNYLDKLNGEAFIVEALCQEVFEYLDCKIKPAHLSVTVEASSNKHLPVAVNKSK